MKPCLRYKLLTTILFLIFIVALDLDGCLSNQDGLLSPESTSEIHGTVAFYHFDETSGSTAIDSSGNGFNGTIFGATRVSGKVGQALQFSSAGSRVEIPALGNVFQNQEITVDAWIYPTTLDPGSIYEIVSPSNVGLAPFGFQINDGKVEFLLFDNGGISQTMIKSTASLSLNIWTYVAVTFNGSDARIYIDGSLDSTSSVAFAIQRDDNILYVGTLPNFPGIYLNEFQGQIDELRISNVVLSDTQIADYYQQTNL
ncbi:MAG TPA: LamG domain-containing protein [Nitrospiria bacterium]|nr:LamG domain-containing protein [Nitrospiria bacterium]